MNTHDDPLTLIVNDLGQVLTHVASQPWGYAGFEVDRAKFLLHTVDVATLKDTLNSVLFVSWLLKQAGPLTGTELAIEQAALRLERMLRIIQMNQQDITARMAA